MTGFAELSDRSQVHRLRGFALAALARFPIEVGRLRLLEHGFNTTFRVDAASGDKFALRIDLNRRKPIGALDAEMAWLAALAHDTDIVVPVPQPTIEGTLHTAVEFEPLGATLNVAVMSWLAGRNLDEPTVPALRELGRITARLHAHARSWTVPPGARFPAIDSVFMDSTPRITSPHPLTTESQRRVFVEAVDVVDPLVSAMIRAGERMPIHADLHVWNVKWLRGRMSVFDFDDAGLGVPAQDLAITTYYLPADDALRTALLDGYTELAPLPPFTDAQFQAALAARTLLLINDVLDINTRELRDKMPRYLANSVLRLRAYLDTGVYVADVPGVVATD